MQESHSSDESSDLIERFLEATRSLGPSEIRAAVGISPQALARYRGGDFKRIFASTRRKIESYLAQHAIPGGEAYNSVSPDIVQAVRTEAVQHIQRALEVLEGRRIHLTDDPAPVDDRVREAEERAHQEERKREQLEAELQSRDQELARLRAQAAATAKLPDPDVSPIQSAPGWHDEDYETVRRYESEDVGLAAGTGTFADQEPVAGEVKFRTSWLREHHLSAKDLFLADVLGDSMEPTICDGDSALVDETHTSPRSGKIYALQAGDGPLVKRIRKRDHRWWADSDNEEYEPQPLNDRARIMGRVVWWAHTD